MYTPKKNCVVLILALFLSLLIVHAPRIVHSAELTHQEKALGFLANVVGLDLARYEVELKSYEDYSSYTGTAYDAEAMYNLMSASSQMTAKFWFKDNVKLICDIRDLQGSMLLVQPATDRLDAAKGFMDRYQSFTGSSHLQPLREMLRSVTELKNMTVTVDDLRLKVEPSPVGEDFVTFQWMYTPNGIHNRYTRITIMFRNGFLEQFSDIWNNLLVGSSEVKFPEEQAISIAEERIQTYSYKFGDRSIGNLTVKDDFPPLAILSMQVRDNLLYPRWELLIPLAEVYPGFVTAIRVYLWADTGEVDLIETSAAGGGGAPPATSDGASSTIEESTPTPPRAENNPVLSTATFAIAAVAISLSIAAVAIIFRRRRKK